MITTPENTIHEKASILSDTQGVADEASFFGPIFQDGYGSIIQALWFKHNDQRINIIAKASQRELRNGNPLYKGTVLFPFPNRLENGSYNVLGKQFHFPINEADKNNRLHGFLFECQPEISKRQTRARYIVNLHYTYRGDYQYYPFPCEVSFRFNLMDDSVAFISVKVKNTGNTDLPFGIGWHPYFTLNENINDLELTLPPALQIKTNQQQIPTGETKQFNDFMSPRRIGQRSFDDGFRLIDSKRRSHIRLWSPKQHVGLEFWQASTPNDCRYFQLCTTPDRQAIAIEPMTCNINAFNNKEGLITLSPGQTYRTRFGVRLLTSKNIQ